jgi:hypothetical protein
LGGAKDEVCQCLGFEQARTEERYADKQADYTQAAYAD